MAVTELHDQIDRSRVPSDWAAPGEMHFRLDDNPEVIGVHKLGPLDLSCDTGYVVRTYEFASPEMRQVTYPNPLDDGAFDVTSFIGARAVTLDLVLRNTPAVDGTGIQLISESMMRDKIMRYFSPTRRPILYFSEHGDYTVEAGVVYPRVRRMFLRGSDASHAVSRPQFNELSMSWVAPRGVFEHTEVHRATINFTEDNLDAEYVIHTNNQGSTPAHWRLEIDGDLETPQIELIVPGGRTQRLWLNYHVEESGTIVVDSQSKTIRIGNKPVGYRYLDDRSDWFRIPVGESMIVLTHSSLERSGLPYGYWQSRPPAPVIPPERGITLWSQSESVNVTGSGYHLCDSGSYVNLLTLKADPTWGDGNYGPKTGTTCGTNPYVQGEYSVLGDGTRAHFSGPQRQIGGPVTAGIWEAGGVPAADQTNTWIWSPPIDDNTGEPVRTSINLTYREAFL